MEELINFTKYLGLITLCLFFFAIIISIIQTMIENTIEHNTRKKISKDIMPKIYNELIKYEEQIKKGSK